MQNMYAMHIVSHLYDYSFNEDFDQASNRIRTKVYFITEKLNVTLKFVGILD